MEYYPVFLDIKGKKCLVVGSGPVGIRKAMGLDKSGAKVTLVSPEFAGNTNLPKPGIVCMEKKYERSDIAGMFLVFAATGDAALNQQIGKDAEDQGILCNIADATDDSDFLVPSTLERGDLVLAVSTSGKSPAMAKTIKQMLSKTFGDEYRLFLELMGTVRKKLLAKGHAPEEHKKIFYRLIENDVLELIKANDEVEIDRVLSDILGNGYLYRELVSIKE